MMSFEDFDGGSGGVDWDSDRVCSGCGAQLSLASENCFSCGRKFSPEGQEDQEEQEGNVAYYIPSVQAIEKAIGNLKKLFGNHNEKQEYEALFILEELRELVVFLDAVETSENKSELVESLKNFSQNEDGGEQEWIREYQEKLSEADVTEFLEIKKEIAEEIWELLDKIVEESWIEIDQEGEITSVWRIDISGEE